MNEKKTLTIKETFTLAVQNHKKNNFQIAEKLYKEILKINSNHFESIYLLGSLSLQIKNLNQAKQLLQKATEINPNFAEAHYNLGLIFSETKEIEKAISCYQKAININPNYADAHNNLGNVLKDSGKFEEAISYYQKAININPNYVQAYYNLGNALKDSGKFEEAISYYQKVIEINPNYAEAHYNIGLAYVKSGKLLKAKESFLKAIKIIPNFVIALNALGNINNTLEKPVDAIYYYKKVAQLQPKFKDVHLHLGNLYKSTGNFKQALNSYELGLKFDPGRLLIYNDISFLNEKIIDTELQLKAKKIIDNEKCSKENLVYGNFILSKYKNKKKNYEDELECLYKAHQYFLELPKNENEFKRDKNFWLKKVPVLDELIEFNLKKKNTNIEYKKLNPIFIVGLPRSGSTLIEKLISSCDKKIKIGEETSIIPTFILNQINNNKKIFDNIKITKKKIISDYFDRGLIGNEKINIFTDKTLSNFHFIKFIIEIFPSAKFINCTRNPVAVIISILKTNLTKISWAHNLSDIFQYFNIYFSTIDKIKTNFSEYFYDIEYEKLVENQETELKKLFKFCKFDWNKKCLEFYKDNFVSLTASNINVRKPIFKDSINTYLNYKKFLDKYGYKYSWWPR